MKKESFFGESLSIGSKYIEYITIEHLLQKTKLIVTTTFLSNRGHKETERFNKQRCMREIKTL